MRRSNVNLVLDAVSLVVMVGMIATGLLVRFILPPASRGGQGQTATVGSLNRHEWGDLHFWLAMTLIGLMVVHVALHWTWVVAVTRSALRRPAGEISVSRRATLGAATAIVCIAATAAFLWVASMSVQSAGGTRGGRDRTQAGERLTGDVGAVDNDDAGVDTDADGKGTQQRLRRGWQSR